MKVCALFCLLALLLSACGGNPSSAGKADKAEAGKASRGVTHGEQVTPPFAVKGEAQGLLLVWVDDKGVAHSASNRSEIPEARREHVRVDSLELAPEQRLDPDHVYVADLRTPLADGSYRVEKWSRDALEALDAPAAAPEPSQAATASAVILYGASWCGACKQAAAFMKERHIAFTEKDIERDPGARQELMRKGQEQGVPTQSIPVIDVRGKLLSGFNPAALLSALDRGT